MVHPYGRNYGLVMRQQSYTLIYARGVTKHHKSIYAKYDSLIREKIEEELLYEPNLETRNRKPLRQLAPSPRMRKQHSVCLPLPM
jgi:hypothetical protein